MNIGHNLQEEKKPKQKRRKKATSSSGEEFDENSKKKRGRPRTVKREDIEGFSDQEIRRYLGWLFESVFPSSLKIFLQQSCVDQ